MNIIAMVFIIMFWWATSEAQASCSGSGTTWSCTAGSTTSDVQTAMNNASDGATITVAPGSYSWGWLQVSMTKGVTLICATAPLTIGAATTNPCTVTANGMMFGINGPTGTSTKLYRLSGFQITGSSWPTGVIWFDTQNPGTSHLTLYSIRIDHNTFTNTGSPTQVVFFCGDNASYTYCYGVMDHNLVNANDETAMFLGVSAYAAFDSSPQPHPQGQANNMFIEDNILTVTTMSNGSVPCMSDVQAEGGLVIRHNTSYNCLWTVHEMTHPGPQNWEVYNNTLIYQVGHIASGFETGYRMIHDQGSGMFLVFNNTLTVTATPPDSTISAVDGYIDANCSGQSYPCIHQPGRDWSGALYPIYGWNNRVTNDGSIIKISSGVSTTFVAPNRDYYQEASPFNGTVGVGFGLLANRPATCTHSNPTYPTLAGDGTHGGVGYFATNDGPQGTLYTCGATNTWYATYTPYTYPHPLVVGGGGGGDITPPAAPVNLQIQ